MRILIQRVSSANVKVNGKITGNIGMGLLCLVGFEEADTDEDLQWGAAKIIALRIFPDAEGKMNVSLTEAGGEILLVSQFTLFASTKKGNRPSFIGSARPETALELYQKFSTLLNSAMEKPVQTGVFGALMEVSLVNDGPVTIWIDTKNKS
jgi:D-aminoacyl-tRNA deacylase